MLNTSGVLPTVYDTCNIRINCIVIIFGARDSVVAKALCYKPEGRGFDTQ
jgi:hypothetical protein